MRLKTVSFKNYKAFSEEQTLQIRPLTILVGKNSSGKSAVAKLFTLLSNSLSGDIFDPLQTSNFDVELGSEFRDLVFGRQTDDPVSFSLEFEEKTVSGENAILSVSIVNDRKKEKPVILDWFYKDALGGRFSFKYFPDKGYVDQKEKPLEINFKGFIPEGFFSKAPLTLKVDYIGPFRVLPVRQFYLTGQTYFPRTGVRGENAYANLVLSKLANSDLHRQVSQWYKDHFDGWELNVDDTNKPYYQIALVKKHNRIQLEKKQYLEELKINLVDVGQGMNQVLPLVVRANLEESGSIIVIEQPELHLHPAAHADLAELFAKSAIQKNNSYIIETHSENFLLRLRKLAIENSFGLKPDDIIIYWIENSESLGQELREITIDSEGTLSDWPEGVFNEDLQELIDLDNARKNKKKE